MGKWMETNDLDWFWHIDDLKSHIDPLTLEPFAVQRVEHHHINRMDDVLIRPVMCINEPLSPIQPVLILPLVWVGEVSSGDVMKTSIAEAHYPEPEVILGADVLGFEDSPVEDMAWDDAFADVLNEAPLQLPESLLGESDDELECDSAYWVVSELEPPKLGRWETIAWHVDIIDQRFGFTDQERVLFESILGDFECDAPTSRALCALLDRGASVEELFVLHVVRDNWQQHHGHQIGWETLFHLSRCHLGQPDEGELFTLLDHLHRCWRTDRRRRFGGSLPNVDLIDIPAEYFDTWLKWQAAVAYEEGQDIMWMSTAHHDMQRQLDDHRLCSFEHANDVATIVEALPVVF